jgi:anti-sigma B factor antagonist
VCHGLGTPPSVVSATVERALQDTDQVLAVRTHVVGVDRGIQEQARQVGDLRVEAGFRDGHDHPHVDIRFVMRHAQMEPTGGLCGDDQDRREFVDGELQVAVTAGVASASLERDAHRGAQDLEETQLCRHGHDRRGFARVVTRCVLHECLSLLVTVERSEGSLWGNVGEPPVRTAVEVFEVTSNADGDGSRIVVRGELDAYRGAELHAVLEDHLGAGRRPISLDASGVTFLDSGGLRVLVDADERLREDGDGLVMIDPSPQVIRMLRYTDLLGRFGFA